MLFGLAVRNPGKNRIERHIIHAFKLGGRTRGRYIHRPAFGNGFRLGKMQIAHRIAIVVQRADLPIKTGSLSAERTQIHRYPIGIYLIVGQDNIGCCILSRLQDNNLIAHSAGNFLPDQLNIFYRHSFLTFAFRRHRLCLCRRLTKFYPHSPAAISSLHTAPHMDCHCSHQNHYASQQARFLYCHQITPSVKCASY